MSEKVVRRFFGASLTEQLGRDAGISAQRRSFLRGWPVVRRQDRLTRNQLREKPHRLGRPEPNCFARRRHRNRAFLADGYQGCPFGETRLCWAARRGSLGSRSQLPDQMQARDTTTDGAQFNDQTLLASNRQPVPDVMGGGVWCQGWGADTLPLKNAGEGASIRRVNVRDVGCQGCQPPKRNYRGTRGRTWTHTRIYDSRGWTPDTPDSVLGPGGNMCLRASTAHFGVRGCQTPTPDTGCVRGVRGLTWKVSQAVGQNEGDRR